MLLLFWITFYFSESFKNNKAKLLIMCGTFCKINISNIVFFEPVICLVGQKNKTKKFITIHVNQEISCCNNSWFTEFHLYEPISLDLLFGQFLLGVLELLFHAVFLLIEIKKIFISASFYVKCNVSFFIQHLWSYVACLHRWWPNWILILTTNSYDLVYLLLCLREPLCKLWWHTINIFRIRLSQFL